MLNLELITNRPIHLRRAISAAYLRTRNNPHSTPSFFFALCQPAGANVSAEYAKPTDPDKYIFEIRSVRTYPEAVKWERSMIEEIIDPMQVGLIPAKISAIYRACKSVCIRKI